MRGTVGFARTATDRGRTGHGQGPRGRVRHSRSGDPGETVQAAHTADFAIMLAGRFTSMAVLTTIQYPELAAGDPPRPYHRTVPDHVLLQGRLAGGGALAVQVAGGRPAGDTPFRMEVVGESGTATLTGGAPRGFQSGLLRLILNGEPVKVDEGETAGLPDPAVNVAGVYAALRDDIRDGTSAAPDFGHAVRLSHLIDDILTAAANGRTTTPTADWP